MFFYYIETTRLVRPAPLSSLALSSLALAPLAREWKEASHATKAAWEADLVNEVRYLAGIHNNLEEAIAASSIDKEEADLESALALRGRIKF